MTDKPKKPEPTQAQITALANDMFADSIDAALTRIDTARRCTATSATTKAYLHGAGRKIEDAVQEAAAILATLEH